ncbi:FAD:protein FMN transferase [Candidatus Tokpelaia sp.]|uniref:FAD:protein FMN transferase n=1 Tax=Candidatus Tokpelaia sp. TaxID=2233777 RepID=UPI00123911A9|nr:FAD:protein FMN transferase [Candidatus Tokpelaia sp.]
MSPVPSYTYQTVLMGSDIVLKFYERQDIIARQAFLLIKNWEDRLTVNRCAGSGSVSEIAAVNAAAGQRPVKVKPEVFALLQQAQKVGLYEGSCFNFAIGPIVKAWNIGFARAHIPLPAEIAALLPLSNPHAVILNAGDCSVFLPQRGMALDLGAIAKGFIADCVKSFLQKSGVKAALINLGGNIHSLGAPKAALPAGESDKGLKNWRVGLQKPFASRHNVLGLIHMAGKSVVTSGIYERYFMSGGDEQKNNRDYAAAMAAAIQTGARPDRAEEEKAVIEAAARGRAREHSSGGRMAEIAVPAVFGERQLAAAVKPALHSLESLPSAKRQSDGKAAFYHHIFDPCTGYPLHNDLMSVTIISDKSVDGEIWTSLLYGFGLEKALKFLRHRANSGRRPDSEKGNEPGSVASSIPLPAIEAIFVTKDKRIIIPKAESFRFELLDKSYQLIEGDTAA